MAYFFFKRGISERTHYGDNPMPEADPRLMTIFTEALEITDSAARTVYLNRVCEEDADLHRRVEALLAAHAGAGRFLEPDRDTAPDQPSLISPTATLHPGDAPNVDTIRHVPADDSAVALSQASPEMTIDGLLGSVRYFGDYELLSVIARGGMGVVFKARQVSLNREVALKMILTGQLASAADVARFRAEAQAAANLDHPSILPIYEVGEHQGKQYFAMKLATGSSLSDKVVGLVNDPKVAVELFGKVCRAVDFAHKRGILHRDLKPSNILLDDDGMPYVTDFGLAKKVESDSNLTQSGVIVGTPSYMAPEQARAERGLSISADVYSLGAILYELLTGQPPFRGSTVVDTILRVLNEDPVNPRTVNPHVDRDLSVIALKCLEKNPAKRYESAVALADDLDRWARGEPVSVSPATRVERAIKWARRKPTAAAAYGFSALTITLALVIFVVFGFWREAEEAKRGAESARDQAEYLRGIADRALLGEAAARQDVERERDKLSRISYARNVRFANSNLQRMDPWRALALLESTPPRLRGWEYGYLYSAGRVLQAHLNGSHLELRNEFIIASGEGHYSVAFSRDGSKIVCTRGSSPVRILDAATWATLAELERQTSPVMWASFNQDGSKIVTVSQNGSAHIWDIVARKPLLEFPMAKGQLLRGPSFSPDGSKVLGNSAREGATGVWDSRTGKLLLELAGIYAAYSPDGSRIATADSAIRIWDAASGALLMTLDEPDQMNYAPAFSSDGTRVVVCGDFLLPRVWDAATGKVSQTLNYLQHTRNPPWIAEFNPDGSRILTTGLVSGPLQLWDTASGDELLALPGSAKCARFSPDGAQIITVEWDGHQDQSRVVIYTSRSVDRAFLPKDVAPFP
jgi:tRNA A-37 threonylcarbamoyl transferase component Bud32